MHARQQTQQVDDVAPLGLDLRDLLRGQQAGVVAVPGLDDGAGRLDGDDLGEGADVEAQVADVELTARVQDVVPLLDRPEAGELHLDAVRSGRDRAKRKFPALVRDKRANITGVLVGEGHRGAGHHLGGRIDDGAGDDAGVLGRGGCGGEQRDERADGDQPDGSPVP
jgi:hypothetical protein